MAQITKEDLEFLKEYNDNCKPLKRTMVLTENLLEMVKKLALEYNTDTLGIVRLLGFDDYVVNSPIPEDFFIKKEE